MKSLLLIRSFFRVYFFSATVASLSAYADEQSPFIDFRLSGKNIAGTMSDGTIIGTGNIIYAPSHAGFALWSEGSPAGRSRPESFIINGQNTPNNALKIRIEGAQWRPNTLMGKGVVALSTEKVVSFVVKVDGSQNVPADRYYLSLSAATIYP